jgi:ankyrin repeat protein
MLKYPEKCKLDHCAKYDGTALILACKKGMTDVALEMLKHPYKCKLDQVNRYGNTALIFACKNEMTDVALELLKYHDMCAINHINKRGNNALFYAQQNNMIDVIDIFCTYVDINSELLLKNKQKELLDRYINKKISQIYNKEEMQQQYDKLNDMLNKINKVSKCGGCIICLEDTHKNTVFVKCKHILCVCSECCSILDKKCPICKVDTPIITECFII